MMVLGVACNTTCEVDQMHIGNPIRTIQVEPLPEQVPGKVPKEIPLQNPTPTPERETIPA